MLATTGPTEQKFGDVSRQTLRVVGIIAAWVVNTFYNYLHQEAVSLHTRGRVGSITDGYRYIVKEYLASFSTAEGYKRLVGSLHKYYVDNSGSSGFAFDEWTREVLEQFVPLDYKAIMSNEQQDTLLRNILISAVEQFSSEIICTKGLLDLLIMNHDEPSIVPRMKTSMNAVLLNERQKIFNNIHKASTGGDSTPHVTMRREILSLLEENVFLKSRAGKLAESLKKSLDGMKMRDKAINALKMQVSNLERQLQSQPARDLVVIPRTQAEEFKATIAHIDAAPLRPRMLAPAGGRVDARSTSSSDTSNESRPANILPNYMVKPERESSKKSETSSLPTERADHRNSGTHQREMVAMQEDALEHNRKVATISDANAAPLSQVEKMPEPFELADPDGPPDDGTMNVDNVDPELGSRATGNDTLALDDVGFWEG